MSKQKELVIAYRRVSSAEQANGGLSLDMQKNECEKWAKARNCDIVHFEDAGKTGSNMNRAGLKSLLQFIKKNKVKCVVVWKLDRLSRCQEDFFGEILRPIKQHGCTIASIMEHIEDIRKVQKVLLGVYIGQAEDELDNTKDRTRAVIRSRVENGYIHGKAPIGYINTRDAAKHGIIVPDENKKYYINRAFELYSTGLFSYERVGQELAKFGFVNGNNKAYPKKRIEEILKNPVYVGKIQYNGEIFEGKHEPIISPELFYRVQLMFKSTRKTRANSKTFVYSNYIRCAKCGYYMVGITKHGAHNSGNYNYYHCSNYKKSHLKEKNIKEESIDKAMQEIIESFDITENELAGIKTQILKTIDEMQALELISVNELRKKYEDLTNIISKAAKEKLSGKSYMDDTTYKDLMKKWQTEKEDIGRKISELTESAKETMTRVDILTDFANRIPELYLKATLEEKRIIIGTITESITYDEDTNKLTVKLKPIFEYLRQLKQVNTIDFTKPLNNMTGTHEKQSEKVIQLPKNITKQQTGIKGTGTRTIHINTKIEPLFEGSKKSNVVGGT